MTPIEEVRWRAAVHRERQIEATDTRRALRDAIRVARREGHSERELQAATGFLVTNVTIHNWTRDLEPSSKGEKTHG